MPDIAIKVDSVSKSFKLPHEKRSSIKSVFVNIFRGRTTYEKQEVLKDISFEINKGEFFGIVGRNGSGKSTLLKLMAGIYNPEEGNIQINGKLVPFIELGVGFNPELTGRENVFLNGALLGFDRKQMEAMYEEIVEFAELERFMDQKLKNYSSGMQVRLAFSIAIQANSDILLLDEVLAVGDESFQRKCYEYFSKLKKEKKTVILVSHDMEAVKRFCDRALLIEKGKVKNEGSPQEVASQYSLDNLNTGAQQPDNKELSPEVKSLNIKPLSSLQLSKDQDFEFEITYELNRNIEVDLGISIIYRGQSIIEHNTKELQLGSKKNKKYSIRYKLPLNLFNPKEFGVDVAIFEKESFKLLGFNAGLCHFIVKPNGKTKGGLLNYGTRGEWIIGKQ